MLAHLTWLSENKIQFMALCLDHELDFLETSVLFDVERGAPILSLINVLQDADCPPNGFGNGDPLSIGVILQFTEYGGTEVYRQPDQVLDTILSFHVHLPPLASLLARQPVCVRGTRAISLQATP